MSQCQFNAFVTINRVPRLINRVLEVASCHVTEQDSELLDNQFVLPQRVDLLGSGWLLRLDADDDGAPSAPAELLEEFKVAGFSNAVMGLLALAEEAQCLLIRIHPDGETYPDYPTFKW